MAKEQSDSEDGDQPTTFDIATRLERLGRLLRQSGHAGGLVPAQWEVLRFLSRANRLSRSPGQVARYLGATKGTVSQSLLSLQRKGFVSRRTKESDERYVLLDLTEAGHETLRSDPLLAVATDLETLGGKTRRRFARALAELLDLEIGRQGVARFGTCAGCRHFTGAATCSVDGKPLPPDEQARLCAVFSGS